MFSLLEAVDVKEGRLGIVVHHDAPVFFKDQSATLLYNFLSRPLEILHRESTNPILIIALESIWDLPDVRNGILLGIKDLVLARFIRWVDRPIESHQRSRWQQAL